MSLLGAVTRAAAGALAGLPFAVAGLPNAAGLLAKEHEVGWSSQPAGGGSRPGLAEGSFR